MQPTEMNALFNMIYATLLDYCRRFPYDTGNMYTHIFVVETEDAWEIHISAPKGNYDYSRAVNEALAAKAQGRPLSKAESENYHWIEKALIRAVEIFDGKGVTIENLTGGGVTI